MESSVGGTANLRCRLTCSCIKNIFLPEESFKSWSNYRRALSETGLRLRDRIMARSPEHVEMHEIPQRSGHEMKRNLTWWDLIWLGMGAVISAGVFVLTGQEASRDAGPAVVLSYAFSGVSAMLSVFCYTEFAVEIPVAGGSFAYLRVELGDFVAFIAAGNILLEYVIGGAAVARSWTSYFATLLNHEPSDFRIHVSSVASNYNELDPIAVAVTAVVCAVAACSMKFTSRLNQVASILHLVFIAFIVAAGVSKANPSNLTPFAPYGARGVFAAASVLFFAYTGFDAVSTMAEETEDPARDIPVGLIGATTIATMVYCVMAATLCLMQPYYQIDRNAPFSSAFEAVGMNWAKYLVAFGALKGMTTGSLVSAVTQARYLTHIARTHMMPPWLAQVHPKTGTPVNATVAMFIATAFVAFFTDLEILSNLLSISTLFIFMLVAVALLVRRYYVDSETSAAKSIRRTSNADRWKLVVFIVLILTSSTAMASRWAASSGGSWVGYGVTVAVWFLSTSGLWLFVPAARTPAKWGAPLVPWLPSASIAMNIFLMGSMDRKSFVRFGVWTALLLAYYLLFGLHASYDTAKAAEAAAPPTRAFERGSHDLALTPLTLHVEEEELQY